MIRRLGTERAPSKASVPSSQLLQDTDLARKPPSDRSTLVAAVIGLTPGMFFPFLVAVRYPATTADVVILGYSAFLFINAVVASSIEATTLAEFTREKTKTSFKLFSSNFFRTMSLIALAGSAGTGLVFSLLYYSRTGSSVVPQVTIFFSLTGFLASLSAIFSGRLISSGRAPQAIMTQLLRMLPALTYLSIWPAPDVTVLSGTLLLGEIVRITILATLVRRHSARAEVYTNSKSSLKPSGAVWQILSASASQASPVLDRWILSGSVTGSVTAYEIADKVFFAGFQLVSNGLLLRRASNWREPGSPAGKAIIRKDRIDLTVWSIAIAVLLALVTLLVLSSGFAPEQWSLGLRWSLLACIGLPFAVVQLVAVRILISLRKQTVLLPLTIASLASNAVFDFTLYSIFGAIGIVLASLAMRAVIAIVYSVAVRHYLRRCTEEVDE